MPNLDRIANVKSTASPCGASGCCRSGACQACGRCPSCPSNRAGARDVLGELKRMLQQDPTGTQNGVNDAFAANRDLGNNAVLMKILGMLGLQAPA
ncbi:MAG: hypothetical protein RMA76_34630 [Deltaproteobacteria bacterium]|jgi:hypothetical protein